MRAKRSGVKGVTDNKVLRRAIKSARQSPYWREVYDKAPTRNVKRYYALTFLSTACTKAGDVGTLGNCKAEIYGLYEKFTIEELIYISSTCGTSQMMALCEKKIEALKEKQK